MAAALAHRSATPLTARQFEVYLERERSLADRGTRRFSLLVVQLRPGAGRGHRQRLALARLARRACRRLRSTDIVGHVAADRFQILLTDTGSAGAQVVAAWFVEAEIALGLDLDHRTYVYPSTTRALDDDDPQHGPDADARSNGSLNGLPAGEPAGRTNGHATSGARDMAALNHNRFAKQLDGDLGPVTQTSPTDEAGDAVDRPWPVEGLWSPPGAPTPLWKRAVDISLSLLALTMLLPLFLLIAIAIRLDSPGPVIFKQVRAGRDARPFTFYKFRSMVAGAETQRAQLAEMNERDGPVFKIRRDPRITRLGRLLRRGSIDELPQLWNVLKGDISLVGPRSPTFDEVRQYEPWHRRRLSVIGGITCLWQVSGRSEIAFQDWMRLDMRYVASRNPWLDLRLLAQTLPAVISGRGAC